MEKTNEKPRREPILYSRVKELCMGPYSTFVAALKEDELPVYAVIRDATGVVEWTSENYAYTQQWVKHFSDPKEIAQDWGPAGGMGSPLPLNG